MVLFTSLRLTFLSAALVSQIDSTLPPPPSCEVSTASSQECSAQTDTVLLQTQHVQMKTVEHDNNGVVGDAIGNCRFARLPEWDALATSPEVQDAYVAAVLRWDGKFASPGAAVSANGITRDHILLDDDGNVKRIAGYTAPSKENLHLSMLAIVLDGTSPLAWNFCIDYALSISTLSEDEKSALSDDEMKVMAEEEALRRLGTIIGEYENWRAFCPGCGGFLNWIWVDDTGIVNQPGKKVKQIPALDNGQMAWSMIAVHEVLVEKGHVELAARYHEQIATMESSVTALFVEQNGQKKRSGTSVNVKQKDKPVGGGKIKQKGQLRDPFEGELMIMFEDMLAPGVMDDETIKKRLWKKVKKGVQRIEFTGPEVCGDNCLPNGPITIESGWRFSAHEQWKYLVLPYLEDDLARRVFANGERARSWDARGRELGGMLAAAYRPPHADSSTGEPVYMDTYGINSASYGFTEPADSDLAVTPYGAFPLILASRGIGLAWHRAMLARNKMQSQFGSIESSEVNGDSRSSQIMTWDTKVSSDLAMVGGTGAILKRFLERVDKYDHFLHIVDQQLSAFDTLNGEDTPFAPAPEIDASTSEDFPNCAL